MVPNQNDNDEFADLPAITFAEATEKGLLRVQSMASMFGRQVVLKLLDGTHVKIVWPERLVEGIAGHKPEYLRAWIERVEDKWPPATLEFMRLLIDDRRMSEFWSWLDQANFPKGKHFKSAITIAEAVRRATRLPGKPGNMTAKQRELYFEQVRKHAAALAGLLTGTKFDQDYMREMSDDELGKSLSERLYKWGEDEDEEGHIVAFTVSPGGTYEMPYDFPSSNLTQTLQALVEWTYWDDHWDGGIYNSSRPIAQSNSDSAQLVYFTCSIHTWFADTGVAIPFPILATLANVALKLEVSDQVDEETVRKQVRRYQARRAKWESDHANAFADAGQNFDDSGNSVLSDPF